MPLEFEQAPPGDNHALGFDRAPSRYDLAPPPFDQEFPQTRMGHDHLAPPPFDQEHHQRDQMEGDYEGDWGFDHPRGLTHELPRVSNVGQPQPNISFDPFRGFEIGPGPGFGLERSHHIGFDLVKIATPTTPIVNLRVSIKHLCIVGEFVKIKKINTTLRCDNTIFKVRIAPTLKEFCF